MDKTYEWTKYDRRNDNCDAVARLQAQYTTSNKNGHIIYIRHLKKVRDQ